MSPPVIAPHPAFGIPKPDCISTQSIKPSESFNFSVGSSSTAGFSYTNTGTDKSHVASRSRPRLMKTRKKQMAASQDRKTVETDLGLKGLSSEGDGKSVNGFADNNLNSGLNGGAVSVDSKGNMEQLGSGFVSGVSGNDSLFGPQYRDGKSLCSSSMNNSKNKSETRVGDFSFTCDKGSSSLDVEKETEGFVFRTSNVDVQKETGEFVFGTRKVDVQKETGGFVFGARKDGPEMNQNLSGGSFLYGSNKKGLKTDANLEGGQFGFGVYHRGSSWKSSFNKKDSGGNLGQPKVHEFQNSDSIQFVFGSHNRDSASRVKLGQQDSNQSGSHLSAAEFGIFNSANFVSVALRNASNVSNLNLQQQDCSLNTEKCESNKVSGSTIPDVRGKVKLDTSGDSEKVSNPCFEFPFNRNDSSSVANNPFGKVGDMHGFTDSGKENAGIGIQYKNACLGGVFVFGGLKGKGSLNSSGSPKPFSEMNQLNRGKADDCNGFEQHNHIFCSDGNSKFQNSGSSGDSFDTGPASSILKELKKLDIGDSEVDSKKSGNFTSNFQVDANNAFMLGGDHKNSDFFKANHPSMSPEKPDLCRLSHNFKSDRNSSFFSSAGIGVEINGGFCEVPNMYKDEKESISFRGNADYSTTSMKFDFSKNNLFPGLHKLYNTNPRSVGSRKSKKRNCKLRQKTVIQQLFSQNHTSDEGNFEQNHKSPGCGSPMDFSPYQDTSTSNAPESDACTGVNGEYPRNEKHSLDPEHSEKPHDDKSTSNSSPPLSAQDGLSVRRGEYKKKYKLRVGLNPTTRRNDLKEGNAKQTPSGTAIDEICEKWRIRGNEAYHAGQLSKAEEFYSLGISSVPHVTSAGYSIKPLLLCYSNRAATRMSLGRMREAIEDCTKASELDTDFLKVTLRAGNCYLVLGEVENAIQCYTKCLDSGTSICLDRRVTIEAADGLHKAKKVAEHILQSARVLQEGTDVAAGSALGIIEEALSISRYSERFLEMKGEALFMLRKYDEVIQLCERTLDVAEKNFPAYFSDDPKCKGSHVKMWRWQLQAKSYYRLGKLDLALDLIDKQEKMPISSKFGDATQESSISLAANIRELLSLKKSGNEAFNSGRYPEAIENYTAAISKSFESRCFMAMCFCNRAAVRQSLGQIVDAISDCSVAIALDDNYLKAISRRATLHEMIRDYKQAAYDLQKLVSRLENQSQAKTPGSRSSGGSVRDLRKARRRLSAVEEMAKNGIPLDLYLILGIKASDAESEIKKAYRKAALRHHPDKAANVLARNDAGDDGTLRKEFGEKIHKDADKLFKIIGEAYAVLSNPSKRSNYDDGEEMRKIYRDSNSNSSSGHPSTSYSSSERGSWYGRQSGFGTSSERNSTSSRRYWYEGRPHSNSRPRW